MEKPAVNGTLTNGRHASEPSHGLVRFSDIPRAIDIPVSGGEAEEAVEVDLEELLDDPTELCTLLENENVGKNYWTTIALAYVKQQKLDLAVDIVNRGLGALTRGKTDEKLGLYNCLCWLQLLRSRDAPRVSLEAREAFIPAVKTKDFYLRAAVATLNDASRISPSYPPLFLARGVLCILRASLLQDQAEKSDLLRQALKSFDDAVKGSKGRNMMAVLGRSRAQFSLGRYADSLLGYQQVLERAPQITDPDPRIGIGCCLWQLGHKDDAQMAWQRALEINPKSKIANVLLGIYHLHRSAQFPMTAPQFKDSFKKAMVEYTQKAFKIDNDLPLACSTFGNYFLIRNAAATVDKLARKAIELTDINAIASDGWYLLGRKEHQSQDLARASDFYTRADQARGGDDRGYLPAKFGAAQIKVLQQDLDGAKYRLEKIVQQSKNVEAMTLVGSLFAEEAFNPTAATTPEDRASAARKAIGHLEAVRVAWKDPKRNVEPDPSVLLNLARLYESDNPERSLQCLQEVEEMELAELSDDVTPENTDDEAIIKAYRREHLSPALLNNIACFHYIADRLSEARDTFQTALNACVRLGERDTTADTDALVTTISFNLARTFEAENQPDEAKTIYQGLLTRHGEYVDAKMRLTYIALRQSPNEDGPKAISQLYEGESTDLEVRSLYGWYLRKAKRRTPNIAEDQEQRLFKHTLQGHDKHDRYSLTAMGNLFLATAREMRRDTDQDKDRRRKMYERAVEFFDKALQLDPRNAYAAQGIGIAVMEDKKDLAAALQIFTKVKESIKDASVFVNLGHVYCELKQYSRGVENYEAALAKDRQRDPQILACLGRAWLLRGKQERTVQAMKTSLDYSQRALEVAPDQIHFKFNVAFVQIQIAQLLYSLPETQRTIEEVEQAAQGLDDAIESFGVIAKSPNPPFPRHDIEQRANMGRNTMRRQLERAIQSQREYEEKNAARLQQARQLRDAEVEKRVAEKKKAEDTAEEQRRKVAEERQKMQERDRQLAEIRADEDRKRQEVDNDDMSLDEATGRKKKRTKRSKRPKKGEDEDGDTDGDVDGADRGSGTDDVERPKKMKKKRKLERRAPKENSKYKSSERVVDSDLDDDEAPLDRTSGPDTPADDDVQDGDTAMADAEDDVDVRAPRRKINRVVDDDDEEADGGLSPPPLSAADVNMEEDE